MEKDSLDSNDELQPEYDLTQLRIRRLGPGRKSFAGSTAVSRLMVDSGGAEPRRRPPFAVPHSHGKCCIVRLEPDVAEMFPNAEAVNEALRFLLRVTQENKFPALNQPNLEPINPEG
jgi:hypothetical protein